MSAMLGTEARRADELLAQARTLSADAAAVEVVAALREAKVPVVLLKGRALAGWLYAGDTRLYTDVDLLVAPDRVRVAEQVLARLGFGPVDEGLERPPHGMIHSVPWVRPSDLANVDLHRTLFGVGVAPAKVWQEVALAPEQISLNGLSIDVLPTAARALHVVLHAAQHDDGAHKALEDLARALRRVEPEVWAEAAALAERLDATPTFALGLGMLPEGEALARDLGVVGIDVARAATAKGSGAKLAVGFDRLSRTPGLRARAAMVAREAVPSRSFIRYWSPLARRGRAGLLVAYLWRPVWLLAHALPSIAAWLRHRADR